MLEVTPAANFQIFEFFKDREVAPIRIFINEGGWGGPSLAMALDKPRDNDTTYKIGKLTFLADKDFMEKARPVKIDFLETGFKLTSNINFGALSCGTCNTTDASCSG